MGKNLDPVEYIAMDYLRDSIKKLDFSQDSITIDFVGAAEHAESTIGRKAHISDSTKKAEVKVIKDAFMKAFNKDLNSLGYISCPGKNGYGAGYYSISIPTQLSSGESCIACLYHAFSYLYAALSKKTITNSMFCFGKSIIGKRKEPATKIYEDIINCLAGKLKDAEAEAKAEKEKAEAKAVTVAKTKGNDKTNAVSIQHSTQIFFNPNLKCITLSHGNNNQNIFIFNTRTNQQIKLKLENNNIKVENSDDLNETDVLAFLPENYSKYLQVKPFVLKWNARLNSIFLQGNNTIFELSHQSNNVKNLLQINSPKTDKTLILNFEKNKLLALTYDDKDKKDKNK